jgi:hypothetical protein
MNERLGLGEVVYSEEVFRIIDQRMLTAVEHLAIGSTPPIPKMQEFTATPQGIIEGTLTLDKVNLLRNEQQYIPSQTLSVELLGKRRAVTETILLELPQVLDNGFNDESENIPMLYGLYRIEDGEQGIIIKSQKELREMGVDRLRVSTALRQKLKFWLENIAETP